MVVESNSKQNANLSLPKPTSVKVCSSFYPFMIKVKLLFFLFGRRKAVIIRYFLFVVAVAFVAFFAVLQSLGIRVNSVGVCNVIYMYSYRKKGLLGKGHTL